MRVFFSLGVVACLLLSVYAAARLTADAAVPTAETMSQDNEGVWGQFQHDRGVGTVVTGMESARDEFDERAFLDRMAEQAENQRRERALFDLNGDGRVTEQESLRVRERLLQGDVPAEERRRIRDVLESGASEEEKERIRRLFHDQDDTRTTPRLLKGSSLEGPSASELPADTIERERLRRLFTDPEERISTADGVSDADQQRIQRLFADLEGQESGLPASADPSDCPRGRHAFFNLIPRDLLFCGEGGPVWPGDGCPRSACILQYGESEGFDDFLGAE